MSAPETPRARKHPKSIASVWLFELACAFVLATPIHAWARSVWGAHPDGDSVLFKPGGLALIEWLNADGPMLGIVLRTTFVLFVVFGLLGQIVSGALVAGLVTAQPRLVPALKSGLSAFFPLLALAFLTAAIQGFFFGGGYYLASALEESMQYAYGDQRAFMWRLVVLGLVIVIVLVVGVIGDLAKVTAARDIALGQTERPIRNAIITTLRAGRRAFGLALLGWTWRAVLALALLVAGGMLNDWEAPRSGNAIWLLFVVHQALLLGRAALRTSWLANALRLVPSPALPDQG